MKAQVFIQWTIKVPPGELTGPWDQGVSINVGSGGCLRRDRVAYNMQKK